MPQVPSKQTTAVATRVSNDTAAQLQREAEARGVTVSRIAREHIERSMGQAAPAGA